MKKKDTCSTFTGTTYLNFAAENTSCSGGTINNICCSPAEADSKTTTYILTLKELKSCRGFDNITQKQAEEIIQALSQLSALCYLAILNE